MKVKINQLDEEVNERNTDLIIQQLKKENDQLHQLVNIYHESHVERISIGSQTKQVGSMYVCYRNYIVAVYIYTVSTYFIKTLSVSLNLILMYETGFK